MITLEFTKIAFDTWRAAKTKTNTPVPIELWDMVTQLLLTYKRPEICRVLGISSDQIKQHCIALSANKNNESHPIHSFDNDFVEAIPTLTSGIGDAMVELTIKGEARLMHLSLPTSVLSEVLPVLGKLL